MTSRKIIFTTALLLGIVAAAVYAANPHFVRVSFNRVGDQLQVCFKEVGLGGRTTLELKATVTVNYSCRTRPGNIPKAWASRTTTVSVQETFDSTNSGNISGCLTLDPPPPPPKFLCPPGLVLVRDSVQFTNVTLTDLTHGITESFPG